ncbi:PaaI family thioesterase [Rhodovulum sp. DZ06]|uniref:PaaI family thioesterase n=1 Tax=Rhodovulum sp. DZ06 TaxID=3425126 RepID=UPI003D325B03
MSTDFTPRTPDWRARIEAAFAAQGMMQTLGARMDAASPGEVTLSAPITPATAQHHGVAHAALSFALGDNAAGFAAQSLMEAGDGVMTVEMKINLMAPGAGDRLRAVGRVERAGRRLTVVRADVWAEAEGRAPVHVATLLGTMMCMDGMG